MSSMVTEVGRMRSSNQMATAINATPKTAFTASIQVPALGNILPAVVPINNNGVPIPIPNANNARPPSCQS